MAVAEIADALAPRTFETEMDVAVLGAFGLEAIVGGYYGFYRVHGIGGKFGFIVEIEIQERPLRARDRRVRRQPHDLFTLGRAHRRRASNQAPPHREALRSLRED